MAVKKDFVAEADCVLISDLLYFIWNKLKSTPVKTVISICHQFYVNDDYVLGEKKRLYEAIGETPTARRTNDKRLKTLEDICATITQRDSRNSFLPKLASLDLNNVPLADDGNPTFGQILASLNDLKRNSVMTAASLKDMKEEFSQRPFIHVSTTAAATRDDFQYLASDISEMASPAEHGQTPSAPSMSQLDVTAVDIATYNGSDPATQVPPPTASAASHSATSGIAHSTPSAASPSVPSASANSTPSNAFSTPSVVTSSAPSAAANSTPSNAFSAPSPAAHSTPSVDHSTPLAAPPSSAAAHATPSAPALFTAAVMAKSMQPNAIHPTPSDANRPTPSDANHPITAPVARPPLHQSKDSKKDPPRRKRAVSRSKPPMIIGKSVKDGLLSIKGADLTVNRYVGRFHNETTTDAVRQFIVDEGITVVELEVLVTKHNRFKSFRLRVKRSDLPRIEDAEFWPTGVILSPFFRPKGEGKISGDNTAST